jgi:hypothetical protein
MIGCPFDGANPPRHGAIRARACEVRCDASGASGISHRLRGLRAYSCERPGSTRDLEVELAHDAGAYHTLAAAY